MNGALPAEDYPAGRLATRHSSLDESFPLAFSAGGTVASPPISVSCPDSILGGPTPTF